jgi:hypothetical protein
LFDRFDRPICSTALFDRFDRQICSIVLFDRFVRQICSTALFDQFVRPLCSPELFCSSASMSACFAVEPLAVIDFLIDCPETRKKPLKLIDF